MQHVVIGIIIKAQQRILIAERLSHPTTDGLWEFPGGKVELAETAFEALQREFKEEIDIWVSHAEPWLKFEYVYPNKHVLLDVWMIHDYEGKPKGAEGQLIRWVSMGELMTLKFPGGNTFIIESLQKHLT